MTTTIHPARIHHLHPGTGGSGPVVYWMQRDQRAADNWALLYARRQATRLQRPLEVWFCLLPRFLEAGLRQYAFMLRGLQETEQDLRALGIGFRLLCGTPPEILPPLLQREQAALLVTDFNPLRLARYWKQETAVRCSLPIDEVDAHNIVPCRHVSPKQEFAARTLRPRLHRLLGEFLTPFPKLEPLPQAVRKPAVDWKAAWNSLDVDRSVTEIAHPQAGCRAAQRTLGRFLEERICRYGELGNDPNQEVRSELSPYLHFGQISAQQVALAALGRGDCAASRDVFLEELVVRRELAENFCFHREDYDQVSAFPDWAKKTIEQHTADPREMMYDEEELETGETHDPLWNAVQRHLVTAGTMHSYLRMYWAKKIMEWTPTAADALRITLRLNDRYQLDGRDPNGHTGAAWCIGGVHDRAFAERTVFGKIRYMSLDGCRRKFDVDGYIARIDPDRRGRSRNT